MLWGFVFTMRISIVSVIYCVWGTIIFVKHDLQKLIECCSPPLFYVGFFLRWIIEAAAADRGHTCPTDVSSLRLKVYHLPLKNLKCPRFFHCGSFWNVKWLIINRDNIGCCHKRRKRGPCGVTHNSIYSYRYSTQCILQYTVSHIFYLKHKKFTFILRSYLYMMKQLELET